jgi:RecA/RadA recombinase
MSEYESLQSIISSVKKKYGNGSIVKGSDVKEMIPRITTGVLSYDLMLGGGWPVNQWSEIIGEESSGKTAMAFKTIAANQALDPDFCVLWIAAEDFVADYAKSIGVDLDRVWVVENNIMEQVYDLAIRALENRAVDMIVIDSLPALVPDDEAEKMMEEFTVGLGARLTGKFFRKSSKSQRRSLIEEDRGCTGIIINQWREKIGVMWGDAIFKSFNDDLARMLLFSQEKIGPLHYTTATVSYHELGRKQLVDSMLGDWILMLDTDHSFAPDLLVRMLDLKKRTGARVLSGIYQYKAPPHAPVATVWREDGTLAPLIDWDRRAEIVEVGTVGAGCLLIDKSVITEIKKKLKEDPFGIRPGLSEDYSFCQRCRDLNIPIHLALQIECHHVIRSVLSIRDYVNTQETITVNVAEGKIQS